MPKDVGGMAEIHTRCRAECPVDTASVYAAGDGNLINRFGLFGSVGSFGEVEYSIQYDTANGSVLSGGAA